MPDRRLQSNLPKGGIGKVAVQVPRVRGRGTNADGSKVRFNSSLVPPYLRKAKSVEELLPWLYLKGISTRDFSEALPSLVGPDADGLSASTITRNCRTRGLLVGSVVMSEEWMLTPVSMASIKRRPVPLQPTKDAQFALDFTLCCFQAFDLVGEPMLEEARPLVRRCFEAGQDLVDGRTAQPGGVEVLDEDDPVEHSSLEVAPPVLGACRSNETEGLVVPQRSCAYAGDL